VGFDVRYVNANDLDVDGASVPVGYLQLAVLVSR
jgi:hypothetical protein